MAFLMEDHDTSTYLLSLPAHLLSLPVWESLDSWNLTKFGGFEARQSGTGANPVGLQDLLKLALTHPPDEGINTRARRPVLGARGQKWLAPWNEEETHHATAEA